MELSFDRSCLRNWPNRMKSVEQEGLVPDSTTVAQFLPFLRRYGRALTGSQASGDAYVVASLEALVADPSLINGNCGPRVALYQLFTRIWNTIAVNSDTSLASLVRPGQHKLD